MNKLRLIICFLVFCVLEINAQIGINTENPQSLFHIDASGNNSITGVPSLVQNKDDFLVRLDNEGQVNVGIGVLPASDTRTQLELGANDKAFMTNNVALSGTNDLVTVPNPIDGMFVYNTVSGGSMNNRVVPGLYYFEGGEWHLILISSLGESLTLKDLQSDVTTRLNLNSSTQVGAEDMDFGSINIYESGSYAFSFRLYGSTSNDSPEAVRGIFYIWLYVNDVLIDFAEMNTPAFINNQPISYSVTLGASVNIGDAITFKLSKFGVDTGSIDYSKRSWTLKAAPGQNIAKTTMIYWKL